MKKISYVFREIRASYRQGPLLSMFFLFLMAVAAFMYIFLYLNNTAKVKVNDHSYIGRKYVYRVSAADIRQLEAVGPAIPHVVFLRVHMYFSHPEIHYQTSAEDRYISPAGLGGEPLIIQGSFSFKPVNYYITKGPETYSLHTQEGAAIVSSSFRDRRAKDLEETIEINQQTFVLDAEVTIFEDFLVKASDLARMMSEDQLAELEIYTDHILPADEETALQSSLQSYIQGVVELPGQALKDTMRSARTQMPGISVMYVFLLASLLTIVYELMQRLRKRHKVALLLGENQRLIRQSFFYGPALGQRACKLDGVVSLWPLLPIRF